MAGPTIAELGKRVAVNGAENFRTGHHLGLVNGHASNGVAAQVFIPLEKVMQASPALRHNRLPDFLKGTDADTSVKNGLSTPPRDISNSFLTPNNTINGELRGVYDVVSGVEKAMTTQFRYPGREVPTSSESPSWRRTQINIKQDGREDESWTLDVMGNTRNGNEISTVESETLLAIDQRFPGDRIRRLRGSAPHTPKDARMAHVRVEEVYRDGSVVDHGVNSPLSQSLAREMGYNLRSFDGQVTEVRNLITRPTKQLVYPSGQETLAPATAPQDTTKYLEGGRDIDRLQALMQIGQYPFQLNPLPRRSIDELLKR